MSADATPDATPTPRPDWREQLSQAADLAILGVAVVLGCLPGLTAGATLATASAAVDTLCRTGSLPGPRVLLRGAARGFWGGLGATVAAVTAAAVLALDLWLVRTAPVPGAAAITAAIAAVCAGVLVVAAVAVVRVGQTGGGWWPALRWALALLRGRPAVGLIVAATLALPVMLAVAVPVTAMLLPGFVLFALHVVVRRHGVAASRVTHS